MTSEFQIRVTIWSLVNRSSLHITGPKHAHRGMAFSPDQSLMAVLEVRLSCELRGQWTAPGCLHLALERQGWPDMIENTTHLSCKAHVLPPAGWPGSLTAQAKPTVSWHSASGCPVWSGAAVQASP